MPNVIPWENSMGSTHHGFVRNEYNVNRTPITNSTNVIAFTWPIFDINQPDIKKNGSSPPKLCILFTRPSNVFIRSWLLQLSNETTKMLIIPKFQFFFFSSNNKSLVDRRI